jgi:hypothetical protein
MNDITSPEGYWREQVLSNEIALLPGGMPEPFVDGSARRADRSSRWAPSWVYVLVIAPVNLGKEQLLPGDAGWWLRAALTATILIGGIVLVTTIYRTVRPR